MFRDFRDAIKKGQSRLREVRPSRAHVPLDLERLAGALVAHCAPHHEGTRSVERVPEAPLPGFEPEFPDEKALLLLAEASDSLRGMRLLLPSREGRTSALHGKQARRSLLLKASARRAMQERAESGWHVTHREPATWRPRSTRRPWPALPVAVPRRAPGPRLGRPLPARDNHAN